MKKVAMRFAAAIALLLFVVSFAQAQYHIDLTPSVSLRETYDDNIFLAPDNKKSDYITTAFLNFDLKVLGQNTDLDLRYSPTLVRYDDVTDANTVRHSGKLTLKQDLAEKLRFDLKNTYLKSEEPLEENEDIEGARRTRNTYQRNRGSASFSYQFGPGNTVTAGYSHRLLENEEKSIDDGRVQTPFARATLWLNTKNGLGFNYAYRDADFSRDDGFPAGDDYTGHSTGIRYIYRFNPHQRASLGYNYTTRDFDGTTEDYKVHEIGARYRQELSPEFSTNLGAGLFRQENERSSDTSGFSYDASIKKRFHRGTLNIGGAGGWDEAYLEAERRGFTRFWSLNARLNYHILETLNGYAGAKYRFDEDDTDRRWETSRFNCGLRWKFFRYFSTGLDYRYAKRNDDIDFEDYTDNQVMLTLRAARLFRW